MKMKQLPLLMKTGVFALALLGNIPLSAKTVYVKPTEESLAWNEQTENVYTDFKTAYDAAEADDDIWVAAGEYPIAATIAPKNVKIYGGFTGTETSIDKRAIEANGKAWNFVNPSILKLNANLANGMFGVASSGSAPASTVFRIDGITLDGDKSNGRTGRAIHIQGAGSGSNDIRITNCIIQNFKSNADGGGFNLRNTGSTVSYCLIQNNEGNKGGAGYFEKTTIHHCEIINNSVPTNQTSYRGNTSGGGGGLFLANSGNTVVYDCYIAGNTASFGGGVFLRVNSSIYNSIIVNNTSQVSGSGISFEARDSGGSVYNCTIAGNMSGIEGGAGVCFVSDGSTARTHILRNSILYNNRDAENNVVNLGIGTGTVTPTISNNILDKTYDPPLTGTANVIETETSKLFTDVVSGDYTPSTGFAGLDMGDDTGLTFAGNLDYAGMERVKGLSIDVGPYEYDYVPAEYPVSFTTKNVTITQPSGDNPTVETGRTLTVEFTVDEGYHYPLAFTNGVKVAEVTEAGGTYSFAVPDVTATQEIIIGAFEKHILPVSDDTYQRRNGLISGGYANSTYLETRGEPGGYAATPLLKFVPSEEMKTAGYNKAELKLVPLTTSTANLNYTVRQFPTALYATIHDVPANQYTNMWNDPSAPVVGEPNQPVNFTSDNPIVLNVTDDYILNFPTEIILSVIKSSNGTVDRFASLENGNTDFVPQLIFTKDPGDGTLLPGNATNEPVKYIQYYTLQGIETGQPAVNNMYIVKKTYESGKTESSVMFFK